MRGSLSPCRARSSGTAEPLRAARQARHPIEAMADPHLIGPVPRTTAAKMTASRGQPRALPADLLRDASRRLGVMSLVAGGSVDARLGALASRGSLDGPRRSAVASPRHARRASPRSAWSAPCCCYFYTRRSDRDPRRMLDLGLAYMVLTAVALGLVFHWEPDARDRAIAPEISWIGAVVLMFAAIVPSTPAKTLARRPHRGVDEPLAHADRASSAGPGTSTRRPTPC